MYAPQSPDLSGFQSSPSKQQQPHFYQSTSTSTSASYAPRSPIIPSFNNQSHQYTNPYQQSPSEAQNSAYAFGASDFGEYDSSQQHMPPIPDLPPSHSFHAPIPPATAYYQTPLKQEPSFSTYTNTGNNHNPNPTYTTSPNMSTRVAHPRVKNEINTFSSTSQAQAAPVYKNPNPTNIEIRTKFPVARIKRIMQADEEVGKVAQVTPVAVNKALELFMIALVSGAAERAREKGGKRVTAQHLKAVVENDEQFDFLKEIVEKIADVQENAGGEGRKRKEKVQVGSDSDEEGKKPKRGKGRKKKSDD